MHGNKHDLKLLYIILITATTFTFVSFSAFEKESNLVGEAYLRCSDSDNGINIFSKGTTSGFNPSNNKKISREDTCLNDGLNEYYCNGRYVYSKFFDSLNGCDKCDGGVCKKVAKIPHEKFLWGFNMIDGIWNGGKKASNQSPAWHLTDEDFISLRDDLGVNAIRFFIHPQFVGLPQKTWNGPESIDYTKFAETDYNWSRLDKAINQTISFGIVPVLLSFVTDEYFAWIYKNDITFLNNLSKGLDYTNIVPKEQVKAYTIAIAQHVAQKFPNLKFYILFSEQCGQNPEGAPLRNGEKEAWQDITNEVHRVAPNAKVFSPEICASMWWWPTVSHYGCGNYENIYYDQNWPRGDKLENYAISSDFPSISFYGTPKENLNFCPSFPKIKTNFDTVNFIIRDHVNGKPFLWSEVGWGNNNEEGSCSDEEMNLNLASFLFADNLRGILVWHGKESMLNPTYTYKCAPIAVNGAHLQSYGTFKKIGDVIKKEYIFLSEYHISKNADGIPVESSLFQEVKPNVFTRYLSQHLVIYNAAPSVKNVTFTNVGGKTVEEYINLANIPISIIANNHNITVANIQPNKLYVLKVI